MRRVGYKDEGVDRQTSIRFTENSGVQRIKRAPRAKKQGHPQVDCGAWSSSRVLTDCPARSSPKVDTISAEMPQRALQV